MTAGGPFLTGASRAADARCPRIVRRLRRSEGQAMVEFVVVLPLLVALMFVLIEMGLTFHDYLRVTDAARVAARAASVARFTGKTQCQAAAAALAGDLTLKTCQSAVAGQPITITVEKVRSLDIPLPGVPGSVTLKSSATETAE